MRQIFVVNYGERGGNMKSNINWNGGRVRRWSFVGNRLEGSRGGGGKGAVHPYPCWGKMGGGTRKREIKGGNWYSWILVKGSEERKEEKGTSLDGKSDCGGNLRFTSCRLSGVKTLQNGVCPPMRSFGERVFELGVKN